MNRTPTYLLGMLMFGCASTVPDNYANHSEMIKAEFQEPLWIPYTTDSLNIISRPKARAPYEALVAYCAKDSGVLKQVAKDGNVSLRHDEMLLISGQFHCQAENKPVLWAVMIDAMKDYGGLSPTHGYTLTVREANNKEVLEGLISSKPRKQREQEIQQFRDAVRANSYATFSRLSDAPKSIGDEICSWNNLYGFVDDVSNHRIRILVKGKARVNTPGFFFRPAPGSYYSDDKEEHIWDDAKNWAACDYSV
ncbi:hypothetical protein K0504_06360 [Neiella marina]|uniref:Lipoprotein n=1 Tax=Neiella holothuriorum TaxID=2870530 RepID=A0ABS7EE84_9GAMM|nr:hypothetical protein [Neiella holothuriorum]MBW8190656.1 hypothetical protein [Neiella holothuriorum]